MKKKPDHKTIGVRFPANPQKVYTYRIRKGVKVYLGQELITDSPSGPAIVFVVRVDARPRDNEFGVDYKFIERKAAPL